MTKEKFLRIMLAIEEQISLQPYKAGNLVPAEDEVEEQAISYSPSGGMKLTPAEEQEEVEEKAPPGWEGTVKAMKKHKKISNPWSLAWWMKHKGEHPHYTKSGKKKRKS